MKHDFYVHYFVHAKSGNVHAKSGNETQICPAENAHRHVCLSVHAAVWQCAAASTALHVHVNVHVFVFTTWRSASVFVARLSSNSAKVRHGSANSSVVRVDAAPAAGTGAGDGTASRGGTPSSAPPACERGGGSASTRIAIITCTPREGSTPLPPPPPPYIAAGVGRVRPLRS